MIQANELRIGNIISLQGYPSKVGYQTFERLLFPQLNNNKIFGGQYRGIPITEEWLIKLGFEQAENYQKGVLTNNGIRVLQHQGEWQFNDLTRNKKLQYVHQLQNLYFALTGQELTI